MPDWQERVTRESEPAIRVEHELRYAMAAPIIAGATLWCDLGCGSGVAAADALGRGQHPARTVLVDVAEDALAQAARELRHEAVTTVAADLSSAEGVQRVRAELLEHAGDGVRCITCFETIEHLADFVPLVGLLTELAEQHGFTIIASVPNDAFWSLENPHHQGSWGEGAFEELRRLLPSGHVTFAQLPLQGSAVAPTGDVPAEAHSVDVNVDAAGVPSHLLIAFGPETARVAVGAGVVQVDLAERRRWERERESHLQYMECELAKERAEIRKMSAEFADWRKYIHELEEKLGLPLSGTDAAEQAASAQNGAGTDDVTQPLPDQSQST